MAGSLYTYTNLQSNSRTRYAIFQDIRHAVILPLTDWHWPPDVKVKQAIQV